jgi:hypothetical protein
MHVQRFVTLAALIAALAQSAAAQPLPKTWDEKALADWATPVAGLNVRPTHISAQAYYSLRIENVRTYPVYYPGREPDGYWDMLQRVGPKPLIEPERLKSEADWVEAGRRVFEEADHLHLRIFDPKLIASARNRETFARVKPLPDGTVVGIRWVPTKQGVAIGVSNCGNCHLYVMSDGTLVPGASRWSGSSPPPPVPLVLEAHMVNRSVPAAAPFRMPDEPLGMWLFRESAVPWLADDVNQQLKTITQTELGALLAAGQRGGAGTRWNGSSFYPTKTPDLIGVKDRKYLDATATHLHRGVGDLMRYAALVSFAETADFGPHHILSADTARVQARLPDEALYALALYIYSLQPPRNPNPFDENAKAGQKIFAREGCVGCHTPPLYTNNKLTLAKGFTPPKDKPASLDVLPISVGADPGLALKTRKGTGYYKVPSLKGVWYRGHYLHDGSAASLEEMFDPERLADTHVPGGWLPPGMKTRAIQGHEFGLKLDQREREELIAFLRTL